MSILIHIQLHEQSDTAKRGVLLRQLVVAVSYHWLSHICGKMWIERCVGLAPTVSS